MEFEYVTSCLIRFIVFVLVPLLIGWGVAVLVRNTIASRFASLDKRLLRVVDTPVLLIFLCLGMAIAYNGTADAYLYYRTLYVISLNENATIFDKIPFAMEVLNSEVFIYFLALASEYSLKIGVLVLGWKGVTNLKNIYNTQSFDKSVLEITNTFGFKYLAIVCIFSAVCLLLEYQNLDNMAAHSVGSQEKCVALIIGTICCLLTSYFFYNKSKKSQNIQVTTLIKFDELTEKEHLTTAMPQVPKVETQTANGKPTKRCPYCEEVILEVAKKCKHCGEWLDKQ